MKTKAKFLSLLMAVFMVISLIPIRTAQAATELSINSAPITISAGGDYIISGSGYTSNTIALDVNIPDDVNITLNNVKISSSSLCAFAVGFGSRVNLTLIGANTLAGGSGCAGLGVPEGAALNITAASEGNSLNASGGAGGAGIGGNTGVNCGTVSIGGGSITANGSLGGPGIGGGTGASGCKGGDGGTVIINGGTITARASGEFGTGIGGGTGGADANGGDGGTVIINGGTVTATGSSMKGGTGIGGGPGGKGTNGINGGNGGNGGIITINSGTVWARSTIGGAGLGGGMGGQGGTGGTGGNGGSGAIVTVNNGSLTATAGNGAAIGGGSGGQAGTDGTRGNGGDGGTFTISNGTVIAGGSSGAGIGGGPGRKGGDGGSCIISGGTVTANGEGGAGIGGGTGIGGGDGGSGGSVTILGGTVTAKGKYAGAGIGGGVGYTGRNGGDGGTIEISSGSVTATGDNGGAGIGGGGSWGGPLLPSGNGGNGGNGGTITITGGTVIATGSLDTPLSGSNSGAGIGGGSGADGRNGTDGGSGTAGGNGGNSGTITISGGSVKATGSLSAGIGGGSGGDGGSGGAIDSGAGGNGGNGGIGGDAFKLTITGGLVTAAGKISSINPGGTGIGGSTGGNGGNGGSSNSGTGGNGGNGGSGGVGGTVIINGGSVTATGIMNCTGIGGGKGGASGPGGSGSVGGTAGNAGNGGTGSTLHITAGNVTATGGGTLGIGGGSGNVDGSKGSDGSAAIDGGSVQVSSMGPAVYNSNSVQEYLTVVTVRDLGPADILYKVNRGNPTPCSTDSNSRLYLWLPAAVKDSATEILVSPGNTDYLGSGLVLTDYNNVMTLTLVPLTIETTGLSPGFIDESYTKTLSVLGGVRPYTWEATGLPAGLTLESGTISGTPTDTGDFKVQVTVIDSASTQRTATFDLTINETFSVDLADLIVSPGPLTPAFNKNTVIYHVNGENIKSLDITAQKANPAAKLFINGQPAESGEKKNISLDQGDNLIPIVVTSPDGNSEKSYTISVNGTANNADLGTLTISGQTLIPDFSSSTQDYSLAVTNGAGSLEITARPSDPKALILLNGKLLPANTPTSLNLGPDRTNVELKVVAQDGTTQKTYMVTVLSPAHDIRSFTLPEQTGPATINNDLHTVDIEVANGTNRTNLTPNITLSEGASIDPAGGVERDFSLPVAYTVTAENGTTQDWTVNVSEFIPDHGADLELVVADLSSPLAAGAKAAINVAITNTGDEIASKSVAQFYIGDNLLTTKNVGKLKPKQNKKLKVNFTVPATQDDITLKVILIPSAPDKYTGNNHDEAAVTIQLPDLTITSASPKGTLEAGKAGTMNVEIANQTIAPAGKFAVKVYRGETELLGEKKVSGLKSGTKSLSIKINVPGDYDLTKDVLNIIIDADNQVVEGNETNNVMVYPNG